MVADIGAFVSHQNISNDTCCRKLVYLLACTSMHGVVPTSYGLTLWDRGEVQARTRHPETGLCILSVPTRPSLLTISGAGMREEHRKWVQEKKRKSRRKERNGYREITRLILFCHFGTLKLSAYIDYIGYINVNNYKKYLIWNFQR